VFGDEHYLRGEVVDALARIDRGTFGRCEECQGEIGTPRLLVAPCCRHCTACARRLAAKGSESAAVP
jgi:RNA polymerase-binding transcription factor DksA